MTRTLDAWLDFQQHQHPQSVALGLERVQAVAARLAIKRPASRVVTVAGTNGKGSCVAMLEAMLRHGERRVGCYTSPHLLRYNERVRVDAVPVSDAELVEAFEAIEAARGDTPLTFFEYGTLAALRIFQGSDLDVALLEVGLGGRLDAVNLVDADVALITRIGIDHKEWLGDDRDSIGREKAGIMRAGRAAVVGDAEPPASVLEHARTIAADLWLPGRDFRCRQGAEGLLWSGRTVGDIACPRPPLLAPVQIDNAAACLAVIEALEGPASLHREGLQHGLAGARLSGRLEVLARSPELIVDVAHNPQAAAAVAEWLAAAPPRRTLALFGALADKDVEGIVATLAPHIAEWHLCGLHRLSPRGLRAAEVYQRAREALRGGVAALHADPVAALAAARSQAAAGDRLLVFGSFVLVEAVLRARQASLQATRPAGR